MAGGLEAFLGVPRRFAWGGPDCLLFPADWLVWRGGVDPAAAYRGRYSTQIGAGRILKREGGLLALSTRTMAEAGYAESDDLGPGDVGIVEATTPGGLAPLGAIWTGAHWIALSLTGLVGSSEWKPLRTWRA